jgi:hypothetical protein
MLLVRRPILVRRHRRIALGAFVVLQAFALALGIVVYLVFISLVHSLVVSLCRTLGKR